MKATGHIVGVHEQYYHEFGEIVRHKPGPTHEVLLFNPKDQLSFFLSEGKYPDGGIRTTWPIRKFLDEKRARATCPLTRAYWSMGAHGEDWKKWRTHLNHGLFSPKDAEAYFPLLNKASVEISQRFPHHAGDLMKFCNLAVFDIFCAAIIGKNLHATHKER